VLPLMLLIGMLGGGLGVDPGLLKVRFNTNEILTSLMLVYVAQLFSTGWCAASGATRKA
jgi:general nucleoside transport system permease protein